MKVVKRKYISSYENLAWMTVPYAARWTGLAQSTIRRAAKEGEFLAKKEGKKILIDRASFLKWVYGDPKDKAQWK